MAATQRIISLHDFARAMLDADGVFAQHVRRFERQFGVPSDDMLAVLAQAAHFCWGNAEYRRDLIEVCRAICLGRPTQLHYHRHVTPERWELLHSYVVGVQHWLGLDLPTPGEVDHGVAARAREWLNGRDAAREALARLFLGRLIADLRDLPFAKLGGDEAAPDGPYADFSEWHTAGGDTSLDELKQAVRNALSAEPEAATELIEGITQPSPPPCVHRYTRYLDIQLTSIGALKWRGDLPPNSVPLEEWEGFIDEAHAGLRAWADGAEPAGELARRLQEALGPPSDRGRAIVRDVLLAERCGEPAWEWLERQSGAPAPEE